MKMMEIKDWLIKTFLSEKIVGVIFIFNLIILLLHLFKVPFVLIDNTTILLMLLVLITPFAAHIKKIKWGDFEAELLTRDIEKLEQQAEKIEDTEEGSDVSVKTGTIAKELHDLAIKDRVLALAKLRIEIELRLKKLFTFAKEGNISGIRSMTQTLAATGTISNRTRNLILDINSILNRVMHSGDILTEAKVDNVLGVGIEIIEELDSIFYTKLVEPVSKKVVSKKRLTKYMDAKYEVVSVIPLAEKPYVNKRVLDQEQLGQFLEGYDEYAEFLVKIKKL